jgi:type I restriction enzyme S subunit
VIPEDWTVQKLIEISVRMTNGFVGPAIRHYTTSSDGVLYIQGYNIEENSFNFHGIKYVTSAFHNANTKSCLRIDDMLTVQTGDVGLTTVVTEDLVGSNCHALIITRFIGAKVNSRFISYYLNSKSGRARMRLIETGTTMKHLNVGDLLQFMVSLPHTLAEQTAIATVLSDMDTEIESLESKLAKAREIKQGMMQELLTGKIRLV